MKNTLLAISIIFLLNFSASSQEWKPTTAAVTFTIKHALGIPATGNFSGLAAAITFDPDSPQTGSLYASIQTATLDTDNSLRDKELKSADYFDVTTYPKITMQSTAIAKTKAADAYVATFDVTIKDVTKSLKVPFTFTQFSNEGTFMAQFIIDRTEFGVGESSKLLENKAKVNLKLHVVLK